MVFKHSLVTPLLKKANLDKKNPSNYRPISNLSFLSKPTERIVLARLNDYIPSNSLLNPHQSGFTIHHTTPQKLCLSLCTINWSLPSAVRKYDAFVFSTSPPHSTLYTTISFFIDFLLSLASLELLYSGSNYIYLLGHSLSEPLTTPHNPSHSPVGSLKARSWVRSSSFYAPHR